MTETPCSGGTLTRRAIVAASSLSRVMRILSSPRIAYQRVEVTIAGHDLDRAGLARRDRRDDILRLEALGVRVRQPDRVEDLEEDRELEPDIVRRVIGSGEAMGLVRR